MRSVRPWFLSASWEVNSAPCLVQDNPSWGDTTVSGMWRMFLKVFLIIIISLFYTILACMARIAFRIALASSGPYGPFLAIPRAFIIRCWDNKVSAGICLVSKCQVDARTRRNDSWSAAWLIVSACRLTLNAVWKNGCPWTPEAIPWETRGIAGLWVTSPISPILWTRPQRPRSWSPSLPSDY